MRQAAPVLLLIATVVAAGCLGDGNWQAYSNETPLSWADDDSGVLWVNHSWEGRGNPFGFLGDQETRDQSWTLFEVNGVGVSNEVFTLEGDDDPPTAARYDKTHGLVAGLTSNSVILIDVQTGDVVRPLTWSPDDVLEVIHEVVPAPDGNVVVVAEWHLPLLDKTTTETAGTTTGDHTLRFFDRDGSARGAYTIPAGQWNLTFGGRAGHDLVWDKGSSGVFVCFAEDIRFYPEVGGTPSIAETFPSDWTQDTTSGPISDTNEALPWSRDPGTFSAHVDPIGAGAVGGGFLPFEEVPYIGDRSKVGC